MKNKLCRLSNWKLHPTRSLSTTKSYYTIPLCLELLAALQVPVIPSRDRQPASQLVRLAFPQFTNTPKLLVKVITNSWSAAAVVAARRWQFSSVYNVGGCRRETFSVRIAPWFPPWRFVVPFLFQRAFTQFCKLGVQLFDSLTLALFLTVPLVPHSYKRTLYL